VIHFRDMGQSIQIIALILALPIIIVSANYLTSRPEEPLPTVSPTVAVVEESPNITSVEVSTTPASAPVVELPRNVVETPKVEEKSLPKETIEVTTVSKPESATPTPALVMPTPAPITPTATTTTTAPTSAPIPKSASAPVPSGKLSCEIDEVLNKQTLGGIDNNANLVRDDVECSINSKYSAGSKEREVAMRHAKAIQGVLIGKVLYSENELAFTERFEMGNEPLIQQYADILECLEDRDFIDELSAQTKLILNTSERSRRYGEVLAGASIEIDGQYCAPKYTWWD